MSQLRSALVILSLVLSVIIGLAIGRGKPSGATTKQGLVIGFAMDTLKEARWQIDRDLFVKQAESQGVKVLLQDAGSNDATHMTKGRAFNQILRDNFFLPQ